MRLSLLRVMSRRGGRVMRCSEVGRWLEQYLDGELSERRANRLVAHLDDCERCGLEADTSRRIKDALTDLRIPVPPDALARLRQFSEKLTDDAAGDAGES